MRLFFPLFMLLLGSLAHAGFTPVDAIAAVVDDTVIMQSEVDKRIADVAFQFERRGSPLPPEEVMRRQVTEQLILETLQLSLATRAGIRIDDKELNAALEELAGQSGLSLSAFRQKLDATPDGSYAEVRDQVKRELIINRLRSRRLQDRIRVTEQDVQNFLRSPSGQAELAGEYRLGHILVALPEEATPPDIAAAEARVARAQAELAPARTSPRWQPPIRMRRRR